MMKSATLALAALAVANAAPSPQGVTDIITAGAVPNNCAITGARSYGLSINPAPRAISRRQVVQIADGQIQAPGAFPAGAVTQIPDGQLQAAAVPLPLPFDQAGLCATPAATVNRHVEVVSQAAPVCKSSSSSSYRFSSIVRPIADLISSSGRRVEVTRDSPRVEVLQAAPSHVESLCAPAPAAVPYASAFNTPLNPTIVNQADLPITGSVSRINNVPAQIAQTFDGQIQAPVGPNAVTQLVDGQIQAGNAVNQIADGQLQVGSVVNQIADGQLQAGSVVNQIPDGQLQAGSVVNQIPDGQIQACNAVTQIADGQLQVGNVVNQIADGQLQAGSVVNQIPDGQLQAGSVVNQIPDGQIQACNAVNQIPDGQLQAGSVVNQIPDGQLQAGSVVNQIPDGQIQACNAVTQIADGQILAPAAGSPITQIADGQIQGGLVKRQNGAPLSVTLNNGILTDNLGRRGYIASNRQLQFDAPPQSGAVYTGGFAVCEDGNLALGAQTQFWACGSSDFNNLYDRAIFPDNCHPVYINLI